MRITEAIDAADELRPGNRISRVTKRRWLYTLDLKVYGDIFLKHENVPENPPENYTLLTDADLIISDADSEVYVWYLVSQIDSATGETDRYNTSAERFNSLYKQFSARYTREHKPIQPNRLHNVMRVGGI